MLTRPALLKTSAAIAWGATIVTAFTGYDQNPRVFSALDERLWFCTLGLALLSVAAIAQQHAASRVARLYAETTRAALTRPPAGAPATTGPLAQLVPLNGQRAAHR